MVAAAAADLGATSKVVAVVAMPPVAATVVKVKARVMADKKEDKAVVVASGKYLASPCGRSGLLFR
jgi:hypothetical protein